MSRRVFVVPSLDGGLKTPATCLAFFWAPTALSASGKSPLERHRPNSNPSRSEAIPATSHPACGPRPRDKAHRRRPRRASRANDGKCRCMPATSMPSVATRSNMRLRAAAAAARSVSKAMPASGKRGLHFRHMHGVAPDHQLVVAGGDQKRGVARRVAEARHRGDAGKHLARREQPRPLLVGRDLLAAGLEIELLAALVGLRHRAVVEPVLRLVLVHDEFGVRKEQRAVRHVGQPRGMIGMHVGEQHGVDRLRHRCRRARGCAAPSRRSAAGNCRSRCRRSRCGPWSGSGRR